MAGGSVRRWSGAQDTMTGRTWKRQRASKEEKIRAEGLGAVEACGAGRPLAAWAVDGEKQCEVYGSLRVKSS